MVFAALRYDGASRKKSAGIHVDRPENGADKDGRRVGAAGNPVQLYAAAEEHGMDPHTKTRGVKISNQPSDMVAFWQGEDPGAAGDDVPTSSPQVLERFRRTGDRGKGALQR